LPKLNQERGWNAVLQTEQIATRTSSIENSSRSTIPPEEMLRNQCVVPQARFSIHRVRGWLECDAAGTL